MIRKTDFILFIYHSHLYLWCRQNPAVHPPALNSNIQAHPSIHSTALGYSELPGLSWGMEHGMIVIYIILLHRRADRLDVYLNVSILFGKIYMFSGLNYERSRTRTRMKNGKWEYLHLIDEQYYL